MPVSSFLFSDSPNSFVKLIVVESSITGMSYTPTSMIFIKVPTLSKFQWHPFSITSSSNIDSSELSILVKCYGNWTTALYNMVASAAAEGGSDHLNNIPVAVEGPYGPATVEYQR